MEIKKENFVSSKEIDRYIDMFYDGVLSFPNGEERLLNMLMTAIKNNLYTGKNDLRKVYDDVRVWYNSNAGARKQYEELEEALKEDCTQAGSIQGPTTIFGSIDKKEEVKEKLEEAEGTIREQLNTGTLRVLNTGLYGTGVYEEHITDDNFNETCDNLIQDIAPRYIKEIVQEVLPSAEIYATGVYHPREYNFANDELEFDLVVNADEYEALKEKAINDPAFEQYLKDNYKSYDGFISFMPDDIKEFNEADRWKQMVQVIMFALRGIDLDKYQDEYEMEFLEELSEEYPTIDSVIYGSIDDIQDKVNRNEMTLDTKSVTDYMRELYGDTDEFNELLDAVLDALNLTEGKKVTEEKAGNETSYSFTIVLGTSNPQSEEFVKLTHHIDYLLDLDNADYPMTFSNVEIEPEDDDVIVSGIVDIVDDEDELSADDVADILNDMIIVDGWEDLDVELYSVNVSSNLDESKKVTEAVNEKSNLDDIANYIKGIVDYDVSITPTGKGFSSYDVNFLNTDGSIMYSVMVNDDAIKDKVRLLNTLVLELKRLYTGKTFADSIREDLLNELNKIHPVDKKVTEAQVTTAEKSAGEYWVGDPCYVLSDDIYDNIWGKKYNYRDGLIDCGNGLSFDVHRTAWGDGCYEGSNGFYYGVDSGTLAVIPKELVAKKDGEQFGTYHKSTNGEIEYENGVFHIEFDNEILEIDTDPKDDDYYYSGIDDTALTENKKVTEADNGSSEFELFVSEGDLDDVNTSSLLFDSGTTICKYTEDGYTLSLVANGDIRIQDRETGDVYKNYGHFPQELIDAIKSGKLDESDRFEVVDNNWFEFFLDGPDGEQIDLYEVADVEGALNGENKTTELEVFMKDALDGFVSQLNESKKLKTESLSSNETPVVNPDDKDYYGNKGYIVSLYPRSRSRIIFI